MQLTPSSYSSSSWYLMKYCLLVCMLLNEMNYSYSGKSKFKGVVTCNVINPQKSTSHSLHEIHIQAWADFEEHWVLCLTVSPWLKIELILNSSFTELNIYHGHVGLVMNKTLNMKQGQICSNERALPSWIKHNTLCLSLREGWNLQYIWNVYYCLSVSLT